MYTIYHIPGIKIGCSEDVEFRVKSQGYNEYYILEEHSDITIASNRERELQKQYGYNMDKIPYSLTVSYCSRAGKIGGRNGKGVKSEGRSLKGERNPKSKVTQNIVNIIRVLSKSGIKQIELSRAFNISKSQISSIINYKTWK